MLLPKVRGTLFIILPIVSLTQKFLVIMCPLLATSTSNRTFRKTNWQVTAELDYWGKLTINYLLGNLSYHPISLQNFRLVGKKPPFKEAMTKFASVLGAALNALTRSRPRYVISDFSCCIQNVILSNYFYRRKDPSVEEILRGVRP